MKRFSEFLTELFGDFVTRNEWFGRMTEPLRERRRANINAVRALFLASGVSLAWLAVKGIAATGPMGSALHGFLTIIAMGAGSLCAWFWFLATARLWTAYARASQSENR